MNDQKIEIQNYPPMLPTRPCKFCLCLQGGSVFADFDVDGVGQAYVVRISYDGYGCCHPDFASEVGRMSKHDSDILLEAITHNRLDTERVARILSEYLSAHRETLWSDALIDHGLTTNKDEG